MNIWPAPPNVSKADVVEAFRRHGFKRKSIKVAVHDWCPFKRIPLIEIEVSGVSDFLPVRTWREDVPRAVHRIKWITRRNALGSFMKRFRLSGGRGTERPNAIMRFVGFSDPKLARKEDFDQ